MLQQHRSTQRHRCAGPICRQGLFRVSGCSLWAQLTHACHALQATEPAEQAALQQQLVQLQAQVYAEQAAKQAAWAALAAERDRNAKMLDFTALAAAGRVQQLETQAEAAVSHIQHLKAQAQAAISQVAELERHAEALNSGWLASLEECRGLQDDLKGSQQAETQPAAQPPAPSEQNLQLQLAAAEQLCQELSGQLLQQVAEQDAAASRWQHDRQQLESRLATLQQHYATLLRCAGLHLKRVSGTGCWQLHSTSQLHALSMSPDHCTLLQAAQMMLCSHLQEAFATQIAAAALVSCTACCVAVLLLPFAAAEGQHKLACLMTAKPE